MALLHLVYGASCLALLLVVPGSALLRGRFPADATAVERWALISGVGLWSVIWAVAIVVLLPPELVGPMRHALMPFLPLLMAVLVAACAWKLRDRSAAVTTLPASTGDWVAAAFAAIVFVLFFLGRDNHVQQAGCLHSALAMVLGITSGAIEGMGSSWPTYLEEISIAERVGNTFATVVPMAVFRGAGYRVATGLFAALLFLSVAALGTRATGRRWAGIAASSCLILTGDVFESDLINVNVIVAWTAALLLLLLHPAYRGLPAFRSFAASALFMTRQITVVAMGALVWALWRDREAPPARRLRHLLAQGALFTAFSLPVLLTNVVVRGHPLGFQSFTEYTPQPHSLFGWAFEIRGMLNWPLSPEVVRTPFNAFPMWVGWPVHLYRQWGALCIGLLLLGVVTLALKWRGQRRVLTWVLFAVPLGLLLGVQENWLQPAKLTIGLVLAPVWATAVAGGLAWAGGPPRRRRLAVAAGTLVATVLALWGIGAVLERWRAPEDARFRAECPDLREETDAYYAVLRDRALRGKWTPLVESPGILASFGRKVGESWASIRDPDFGARPESALDRLFAYQMPDAYAAFYEDQIAAPPRRYAQADATGDWVVDLVESPMRAERPVHRADPTASDGSPVLDLTAGDPFVSTPADSLELPFSNREAGLLLVRTSPSEAWFFVTFPSRFALPVPEPEMFDHHDGSGQGPGPGHGPPRHEGEGQRRGPTDGSPRDPDGGPGVGSFDGPHRGAGDEPFSGPWEDGGDGSFDDGWDEMEDLRYLELTNQLWAERPRPEDLLVTDAAVLRLPAEITTLMVSEIVLFEPARMYRRYVTLPESGDPRIGRTYQLRHN